jgi:gamma-glutamylcyclotransferase (GGCT)/AIG2-like uncharacterized protein YtfP
MSWLNSLKEQGHILEAAIHFNEAKDRLNQGSSKTEVARFLSDALNKIQTEWLLRFANATIGNVKAFQSMILEVLEEEARECFLNSNELKNLVEFKPQIMNHDTLRRHDYRPNIEIESNLKKKASEEHRKLSTAYEALSTQREKDVEDRVLKRTAELLYIVRSNIAHGEKTPYGPDLEKKVRDEQISAVVVPIQCMLFDMLLDYPNQKLFTYGTLVPGKPNNSIISALEGKWERCTTSGQIIEVSGLSMFRWEPYGQNIKGQLFVSPDISKQWTDLDKFEGDRYKRCMITVDTNTGISVANAYLDARIEHLPNNVLGSTGGLI